MCCFLIKWVRFWLVFSDKLNLIWIFKKGFIGVFWFYMILWYWGYIKFVSFSLSDMYMVCIYVYIVRVLVMWNVLWLYV